MTQSEQTTTEETSAVSAKRNITAVVVSTVVAVALGAGAEFLIGKVSSRVRNSIAPATETE